MGEKNKWSVGGYVSKKNSEVDIHSTDGVLYEKYKGKEAYGSKEWETTKGEKTALIIVMIIGILIGIAAFVVYFMPSVSTGYKILTLIIAGVLLILMIGGLVLTVTLRHNKKDPIQMQYYDVDYEQNNITGEGYDNTREITKEEFYGENEDE